MGTYPYTDIKNECRKRLRILKDESDDTLIQILWKIIEPNRSIDISLLNDYLKIKYEDIREGLSKAYFIYSLLIYCYDVSELCPHGVNFMSLFEAVKKRQYLDVY